MIYYQSGMKNNQEAAIKGAELIERVTGQKVGIIHNDTDGLAGDFLEYVPSGYSTKDVLNAKMYEDISKNGDKKNLIVLHSAGNEDAYKALKVLNLEDRSLGNQVEFISVGSPRSESSLRGAAEAVDSSVLGQYNNWKDPVIHPKMWAAGVIGTTAVATVGSYYVLGYGVTAISGLVETATGMISTGVTSTMASTGLVTSTGIATTGIGHFADTAIAVSKAGAKVVGAGATGVTTLSKSSYLVKNNIKLFHTFEMYVDQNQGGMTDTMIKWGQENPSQTKK